MAGSITTKTTRAYDVEDKRGWMMHLAQEGFVVIKDVITQETADETKEMVRREMCEVSEEWDWNDTGTWVAQNSPMNWNQGGLEYRGFGQSDSMWKMRLESRAHEIFGMYYKTDDLVTSFEGWKMFVTNNQVPLRVMRNQSPPERDVICGMINVMACGENDAGFVCVPGSHMFEGDIDIEKMKWEQNKVVTPERSMILYHSTLIHGMEGISGEHTEGKHMNSLSAGVTFAPANKQTSRALAERMRAYHMGKSSTYRCDIFEEKKAEGLTRAVYTKRSLRDLEVKVTEEGQIPEERLQVI